MDPRVWWYLTRASAIVAWGVLVFNVTLGSVLASKPLRRSVRPPWFAALHRHTAAVMLSAVGVHLATLVADSYVRFSWRELLVPMASTWHPVAVTFGVFALYVLVLVQSSSLLVRWIPRQTWRGIHLTSYLAFVLVGAHAFAAGSDVRSGMLRTGAIAVLGGVLAVLALRVSLRGGASSAPAREPGNG